MSKYILRGKAISFRKQGHTLTEVASHLGISKSTAALYCKEVTLSAVALLRIDKKVGDGRMKGRLIGARMNREMREERVREAQQWAEQLVGALSLRDVLFVGIGLYWGEGAKARKLNFTNSDPVILMFMKQWFQVVFKVPSEDFLVRIYINESHRDRYAKVKRFWIRTLKIRPDQLYEPTFIERPLRKVYENRETYYGVVSLRIRKSTDLQYKILGLMKAVGNAGVAQVVRALHS